MRSVVAMKFGWIALVAMLLANTGASACQEPEKKSVRQLHEEALVVVRGRAMAAEVIDIADLGESCNAEICDVLKVRLAVFETFKGEVIETRTVYSGYNDFCGTVLLPGWEFVLYLEKRFGVLVPNRYSFVTEQRGMEAHLAELRTLAPRRSPYLD